MTNVGVGVGVRVKDLITNLLFYWRINGWEESVLALNASCFLTFSIRQPEVKEGEMEYSSSLLAL